MDLGGISNLKKSNPRKRQRFEEILSGFSLDQIEFPTIPVTLSCAGFILFPLNSFSSFPLGREISRNCEPGFGRQNNITLKVEKLKSSQQWQLEIQDIIKHGPAGFPKGSILKAFEQSLQRLKCPEESDVDEPKSEAKKNLKENNPVIQAVIENEGALVLNLRLPIMGFPVDFEFKLLPLVREHLEISETALRDAENEIMRLNLKLKTKLRAPSTSPFISLGTTIYTAHDHYMNNKTITWNVLEHNSAPTIFVLSKNQQTVQVKEAGFYHVNVKISSQNGNGYEREVRVMKNNQILTNSYTGSNSSSNVTVHINDIIQLNRDDQIYINFASSSCNMTATQTPHQFWITKIA